MGEKESLQSKKNSNNIRFDAVVGEAVVESNEL